VSTTCIVVFILISFPFILPSIINRHPEDSERQKVNCYNLTDEAGNPFTYDVVMRTLLLFPSISFAFSFECSVLPIHEASKKKDPRGVRSFRACIRCLCIVLGVYLLLMVHSVIYGEFVLFKYIPNISEEDNKRCEALYSMGLFDVVSYAGQLHNGDNRGMPNIFAILLQLCFFVQCTLQLLYTFYECQNHIKILTREILYKETSRYVEQVKISEKQGLVSTPFKIPNKRTLT
jgi:hypothetical protein